METELQLYRTHMDELVEAARARARRGLRPARARGRESGASTEEALRRREEELDALQRMAEVLAGRATLAEALDEATAPIAGLFKARYARVRLLADRRC